MSICLPAPEVTRAAAPLKIANSICLERLVQMEGYTIVYTYNNHAYQVIITPTKGWEDQFLKKVLDRIESIVRAGGVIMDIYKRVI